MLSDREELELLQLLEDEVAANASRLFPDTGEFRRELYQKQLEFFRLGATTRIRAFMAANRVGKSLAGCYEMMLHLTGRYPGWWEGKRFDRPVRAWAVSDTSDTTRDGLQTKLFGPIDTLLGGIVPTWLIGKIRTTPNGGGAFDVVQVKHASGGWSNVWFKAYADGRAKFQAVEREVVLLDEEPKDAGIYTECVTRTGTVGGVVMLTFTALRGITPLVMRFMPELGKPEDRKAIEDDGSSRAIITCGWNDIPHLTEDAKREMSAEYATLPQEIQARTTGIPSIGSGAVYPIPEADIKCKPFAIPKTWKKAFALDPGWRKTAGVWGAINPDTGVNYLFSEYYRGQAEPEVHATGILARGEWIPGVSDRSVSVRDGKDIIDIYREMRLRLKPAKKSDKHARIAMVHSMLSSGMLKVFDTLENWLYEYRLYQTDEHGRIKSEADHLMNATEYYVESGIPIAEVQAPPATTTQHKERTFGFR